MSWFSQKFNSEAEKREHEIGLAQEDNRMRLDILGNITDLRLSKTDAALVSFDQIITRSRGDFLVTGEHVYNLHIDWDADDSFTRTMEDLKDRVIDRIETDPTMQRLLADADWDMQDREAWEERLANIVSEEVETVPAFANYRSADDQPGLPAQAERSSPRLNLLTRDMDNGTQEIEFDCDKNSMVEGSLMQFAENHFLNVPEDDGQINDLRDAHSYFLYSGDVLYNAAQDGYGLSDIGYHATIVSSATGNIIEATSTSQIGTIYNRTIDADFYDIIQGRDVVTENGTVYGANFNMRHANAALEAVEGWELRTHFTPLQQALENYVENPQVQAVNEALEALEATDDPMLVDDIYVLNSDLYPEYTDLVSLITDFRLDWDSKLGAAQSAGDPQEAARLLQEYNSQIAEIGPLLEQVHEADVSRSQIAMNNVFDSMELMNMSMEWRLDQLHALIPDDQLQGVQPTANL